MKIFLKAIYYMFLMIVFHIILLWLGLNPELGLPKQEPLQSIIVIVFIILYLVVVFGFFFRIFPETLKDPKDSEDKK